MNVRFAESCRNNHLDLLNAEREVEQINIKDKKKDSQCDSVCEQDIHIGVFFDGTNNNKYRDTPGFAHSNVARLYEVYPGTQARQSLPILRDRVNKNGSTIAREVFPDKAYAPSSLKSSELQFYRKIYVPGVGTPMPDIGDLGVGMQKTGGLSMALMGQARLDWAMLQFCNQVHAAIFNEALEPSINISKLYKAASILTKTPSTLLTPVVDIGVEAERIFREQLEKLNKLTGSYDTNAFDSMLGEYERRLTEKLEKRGKTNPALRKIRLSVFGFSRGAAKARAWVNMVNRRWKSEGKLKLAGIDLQIDFLGIFDTVASVGVAQIVPHANGHFEWADEENMIVPDTVKRCVHLVAAFEVRGCFPLDSVCQGDNLPSNCKEIVYPGVHSDVGGGYPPGDQGRSLGEGAEGDKRKLSQIPLAQMYREARMAGVPLAPAADMNPEKLRNFAIDPDLKTSFNNYIATTRNGSVPPTLGKGDKKFGSMFPTETQPRDSIWRLIRRHHAYLLQWRKAVMERMTDPGANNLSGLKASKNESIQQDIEDIRGAEEELRKEVAFLQSANPNKFEIFDDPLLESIRMGAKISPSVLLAAGPIFPLMATTLSGFIEKSIRGVMQEKQRQWDTWLKKDWAGDGALPSKNVEKIHEFFEQYVHDSRAWFKPFLRANKWNLSPDSPAAFRQFMQKDLWKLAPDDEEWFVLGGRMAEQKKYITELSQEVERLKKTDDKKSLEAAQKALAEMKKDDRPLIMGGREPYRQWGYLRHRRIYQSGVLMNPHHTSRQTQIEREEQDRNDQARHERLISEEKIEHESNKAQIKKNTQEVQNNPNLTSRQKDDYLVGARLQYKREMERHEERMRELKAKNAMAVN